MKGFKRQTAGSGKNTRLPITPQVLRAIKQVWQGDKDRDKVSMLWAAVCTCFFGFLRSGEIVVPSDSEYDPTTHLSYGDVRLDNPINP